MSKDKLIQLLLGGATVGAVAQAGASVTSSSILARSKEKVESLIIAHEDRKLDLEFLKEQNLHAREMAKIQSESAKTIQDFDSYLKPKSNLELTNKDAFQTSKADVEDNLLPSNFAIGGETSGKAQNLSGNITEMKFSLPIDLPDIPDTMFHHFCAAIFLFAFVGLICGLLVGYNILVSYYSERLKNKTPSWLSPLLSLREKYAVLSNSIYILLLIFTQIMIMALSSYHFFFS